MKTKKTNKGFYLNEFQDHYLINCSLQKSSVGGCVWLGVDDVEPEIMVKGAGWQPYDIPKEVLLHSRMHLNKKQVKSLIIRLQNWIDNGTFKKVKV